MTLGEFVFIVALMAYIAILVVGIPAYVMLILWDIIKRYNR